jgi:single-strand DNA-binding protein
MGYCRISVIGNLGADAETRYTQKGSMLVTWRMAVNDRRRGQDGEYVENTEWFKVTVSGSKAEYAQRFAKGNRVLVDGRLSIEHWTGRDGTAMTTPSVWADEVTNLSPRDYANGDGDGQVEDVSTVQQARQQVPAQRSAARQDAARQEPPPELDELPF